MNVTFNQAVGLLQQAWRDAPLGTDRSYRDQAANLHYRQNGPYRFVSVDHRGTQRMYVYVSTYGTICWGNKRG
jgi:hypothetical protein